MDNQRKEGSAEPAPATATEGSNAGTYVGGLNGPVFACGSEIGPELTNNAYSHVHHADALRLLERGRELWLASLGFSLQKFLEADLLLMVTAIEVSYLRELRVGPIDLLIEDVWFGGVPDEGAANKVGQSSVTASSKGNAQKRAFVITQSICRVATPDGVSSQTGPTVPRKTAVQARVSQVFVSRMSQRSVAPPQDFMRVILGIGAGGLRDG